MDTSAGAGDGRRRLARETVVTTNGRTRLFSLREWVAVLVLRSRYQQHSDQFSARELDHLRFIRWLHQTGRLVS